MDIRTEAAELLISTGWTFNPEATEYVHPKVGRGRLCWSDSAAWLIRPRADWATKGEVVAVIGTPYTGRSL